MKKCLFIQDFYSTITYLHIKNDSFRLFVKPSFNNLLLVERATLGITFVVERSFDSSNIDMLEFSLVFKGIF